MQIFDPQTRADLSLKSGRSQGRMGTAWTVPILISNETALLQSELKNLAPHYRRQIIRKQDEYRRLWLSVLDKGIAQNVFKVDDPKLAFFGIVGALNYVEHWFNPSGRLSREDVAEIFGRWVMRSLGA